jgi:hypothetical protein
MPNPQAGGPPVVGCPRLRIQYIRSYPPCLEAVSSILNLRTRHAVMTRNQLNMVPVFELHIYSTDDICDFAYFIDREVHFLLFTNSSGFTSGVSISEYCPSSRWHCACR